MGTRRKLQSQSRGEPALKFRLDDDYIAFAVLMIVFGIVGITATASVTPNIFNAPSCNCIPGPAARLQELCVTILAIGLVLAPIGFMRKTTSAGASGGDIPLPAMRNGGLFFLGVALVIFGVALVAAPSFLVLKNQLLLGEGVGMVAFGALLGYNGGRSPQVAPE